jgi:hypothetical protein
LHEDVKARLMEPYKYVIVSALRRHPEPTKFLNITSLPAWASPTVRLHEKWPRHELNSLFQIQASLLHFVAKELPRQHAKLTRQFFRFEMQKRQTFSIVYSGTGAEAQKFQHVSAVQSSRYLKETGLIRV